MKSKTIALSLLSMIAVMMVMAGSVSAYEMGDLEDGVGGYCEYEYLTLHQKDPTTWQILDNGVEAESIYSYKCNKIVLYAYNLIPRQRYMLIQYTEPTSGFFNQPQACLGYARANYQGFIRIRMPLEAEWATSTNTMYANEGSNKLWLVPISDLSTPVSWGWFVNDGFFNAWNPQTYLFEHNLI